MLFCNVEKWIMALDFILIAGISLLFLLVLFLLKSKSGFSKKLLALFFVNSIFFLLYYYAFLHKSRILGGIAVTFGSGTGFLLGPSLLFYIRSLIWPAQKVLKPLLIHLIPFYFYWFIISAPVGLTMIFGFFEGYHTSYLQIADYINLIENAYFLGYIWVSYKLVISIQALQGQIYSYIESNNLKWISFLIIGIIIIVLLDSMFSIYELIYPPLSWNIGTVIAFSLIILYVFLGYKGMFQSHILLPNFLLTDNKIVIDSKPFQKEIENARPVKQLDVFSIVEIETLKLKLQEVLSSQKIFLNDSLSLSDLAEQLQISDKKLSELLNQHLNTNFYNLINEYRVAEVKRKIEDGATDKYTLLSLAYDCGFQSKTSFNRVFKQKTGMSPSMYKEYVSN